MGVTVFYDNDRKVSQLEEYAMVLKEWSKVRKIYKDTRKQMYKALFFPRNVWLRVYSWGSLLGMLLSSQVSALRADCSCRSRS